MLKLVFCDTGTLADGYTASAERCFGVTQKFKDSKFLMAESQVTSKQVQLRRESASEKSVRSRIPFQVANLSDFRKFRIFKFPGYLKRDSVKAASI
jgi:hypothetical protein